MTINLKPTQYVLPMADPRATLETVGGKGASLARLLSAGLPVPDGFHITTAAYQRFVSENNLQPFIQAAIEKVDINQPATLESASAVIRELFAKAQTPPDVAGAVASAYASLVGRDPVVAVRSSATAEDLPDASFAGQQETYLNVYGIAKVLEAVKRCWASLWTARAIGYRERQGIGTEGLSLSVVVQLLVPAEAAGILFTANPVTGHRNQAMISAAWGLGEAVVGGLVTPDAILVDKISGNVLDHQIADKQVMTIRFNGTTAEQPVPAELRHAPVLTDQTATELTHLGVQIEDLYGMPMDIEWALADGVLAIVQARPITALPEPTLEPPTDWPLPDPKGPYMRGSIVDFMPDPLTPLFKTLGVPAIKAGMQRTMKETIGSNETSLLENYISTINDYAYLYIKLTLRGWLWVIFRMIPATPRLIRNAEKHWREIALSRYSDIVTRWQEKAFDQMTATDLLLGIHSLTDGMGDYLTSLQVDTLGAAAGTEGLFTTVYDKLIKREGDPPAAALLLGANNKAIQAEKSLYDLAQWCIEQSELATYLLETPSNKITAQLANTQPTLDIEYWSEWQSRFQAHLKQYGHSIYDLDFAKPLPVDDPLPILETLKLFIQGEGTNPHKRQESLFERRELAVEKVLSRIKGLKLRLFKWALRWAQVFTLSREDSIFDIGLGYPTIRQMLYELGHRLVKAQAITSPDDIFWLERKELEVSVEGLDRGELQGNFTEKIHKRKIVWHAEKRAVPPQQLPTKGRVMGIKTDAFMPVDAEKQTGDVLKGVAASPGKVSAKARVLMGPEDFAQMRPGDILVAEITTPAWTPLFAMASGIVTDIGGPLSHGSIVAREYGIPAVLGTGVATQRIHSSQLITVDGDAGTVTLEG